MPTLGMVIPYLELSAKQEYLVQRIKGDPYLVADHLCQSYGVLIYESGQLLDCLSFMVNPA